MIWYDYDNAPDPADMVDQNGPDNDTCACDMRHPDDDTPFSHHPYCIVGHRRER